MSSTVLRTLWRAKHLATVCEAGPSRPRAFQTSAALPTSNAEGRGRRIRPPDQNQPPDTAAVPDRGARPGTPEYVKQPRALSKQFTASGRARSPALLNAYLGAGSLPFDVPARGVRAAAGAVKWCLADPTGKRARLALRLAHTHLSLTIEPAPHTARYQARRSRQYAGLLAAFLADGAARDAHGAAVNHDSAWSLLRRQAAERVPLAPGVVARVLRVLRPPLADILPLLPHTDQGTYAATLRALVQDYAPPPAALRALAAHALGPEERWGHAVHAALVHAHFPAVDFRGALHALGGLKARVLRDKAAALESGAPWPPADAPEIAGAYTDVMALWCRSRFTRARRGARLSSAVPAKLAADLVSVLRAPAEDAAEVALPAPFLNAWLNAERIAQNHAHIDDVWRFLSGCSVAETLDGRVARSVDRPALIALLKYLKLHREEVRARDSLRALLPLLPLRDGGVLNALIALLEVKPDLGLLAAILRSDLTLDPRSIDLSCATLIYRLREVSRTQPVVVDGLKFPADSGATSNNITSVEWNWVARLLGQRDTPTRLPLSLPTAELEERAFDSTMSQFYGGMTRVIGRKDRIDRRVDNVRSVLADIIERTAGFLAKREERSLKDLKVDFEQAKQALMEHGKGPTEPVRQFEKAVA